MRYFYDCEFLEGKQDKRFLGIKYGETKPTIDLISIGIAREDGQEYYAISKDFNLKEAWNRYDEELVMPSGDLRNIYPNGYISKKYWIRENVLRPIFDDLKVREYGGGITRVFGYQNMKSLIEEFGKTNEEIAEEILDFTGTYQDTGALTDNNKKFYTYYGAYDHVALCWLYGKMIDLPDGFPMYSLDLKQELDRKVENLTNKQLDDICHAGLMNHPKTIFSETLPLESKLRHIKNHHREYPKQSNEHNALADARWNFELYKFIEKL